MSRRKLPEHIRGTHRAWKTKKRREARALYKTAWTFLGGAAYTPAGENVGVMLAAVKEIRRLLSVKEWGR